MIIVTGGAGFIGSNFVLEWLKNANEPVLVIDKLTYAGSIANLRSVKNNPALTFIHGDINDQNLLHSALKQHQPRAILNFAAESHVDRSINKPDDFIQTNINGTFSLLAMALQHWRSLNTHAQAQFRFLHVSTDEVYGSLSPHDPAFTEQTPYSPNNPYSASKAASDHLVNAYHHTYGLPTIITNCSNNYGPYQFPEKLIPLTVLNALQNKPLFVYGDGLHVRDWLYVTDHCSAIRTVLANSKPGETYNIGGHNEKTNIDVVKTICRLLDEICPHPHAKPYAALISYIEDRPGHDRRYAIDARKIQRDLNWLPAEDFDSGIRKTVLWYLQNMEWVDEIKQRDHFQSWLETNYDKREVIA